MANKQHVPALQRLQLSTCRCHDFMGVAGNPEIIQAIDDAEYCAGQLLSKQVGSKSQKATVAQGPQAQLLLERYNAACARVTQATQEGVFGLSANHCPCMRKRREVFSCKLCCKCLPSWLLCPILGALKLDKLAMSLGSTGNWRCYK